MTSLENGYMMEVNHSLFIAAEICDQKRNGAGLVRSVTGPEQISRESQSTMEIEHKSNTL